MLGLLGLSLWGGAAPGCAGTKPQLAPAVSQRAVTADQVLAILRRRHVDPALSPAQLSERAFDALLRALDPDAACAGARARLLPQRPHTLDALRAGHTDFVQLLASACTGQSLPEDAAAARALDALAKAFDPHSAFLSEEELAAERASIHAGLPEALQARGRLIDHDGVQLALIVLPGFYLQSDGRSAARDVRYLIDELTRAGARSIVLDLRGNRGGVIEEALRLLAALGCEGDVARVRWAGGALEALRVAVDVEAYRGPLALVIDGGTAGVSETFAGAIQDARRGALIGQRSAGHGSAQTLVLLSSPKGASAGAVRVTDRGFLRLSGAAIEDAGVTPDVALEAIGEPGAVDGPLGLRIAEALGHEPVKPAP
jgi:C-terminal processing protease CtpA/Prc